MHSQNHEDDRILEYFNTLYGKDYTGTLLDIGANDGVTVSNSRAFIERGWVGDLVEPAAISLKRLKELYKNKPEVKIHGIALDTKAARVKFYESSGLFSSKDSGLLSTIIPEEVTKRGWVYKVKFNEYEVDALDFQTFSKQAMYSVWDFISIDAEGKDWDILQQIDLNKVKCQCLCVEHNSIEAQKYIDYAEQFGFSMLLINYTNVVMIKA